MLAGEGSAGVESHRWACWPTSRSNFENYPDGPVDCSTAWCIEHSSVRTIGSVAAGSATMARSVPDGQWLLGYARATTAATGILRAWERNVFDHRFGTVRGSELSCGTSC